MRPNQQNKRSRGRNNGGRKNSNPLSRNFESNGPDVKIRGNASHVADKYVQLARDATASGDLIMAENYFQHAEHYFRIVSAAQQQNAARNEQQQQQPGFNSQNESDDDDGDDDSGGRNDRDDNQRERADAKSDNVRSDDKPKSEDEGQPVEAADSEEQPAAPKRRRRAKANGEDGEAKEKVKSKPKSDPGDEAQPETGDLPAFLTNGQAAE